MADLPAVNWLAHALKKFGIPELEFSVGRDQGSSKDHSVKFSDEYIRDLFLGLAELYEEQQDKIYRLSGEVKSSNWRPVSEIPDGPWSSCRNRPVLVISPVLQYVVLNGVATGYHDGEQWFVILNGKHIPHAVTFWRHIPPSPTKPPEYQTVKEEVENLRKDAGYV